jgi:hypothetical protein
MNFIVNIVLLLDVIEVSNVLDVSEVMHKLKSNFRILLY